VIPQPYAGQFPVTIVDPNTLIAGLRGIIIGGGSPSPVRFGAGQVIDLAPIPTIGDGIPQTTGPRWFAVHDACRNDDAVTIDGDLYGDINKNNPDDPTLAYGTPEYYRCYQVSELKQFFKNDDQGYFHFYVPDYNPRIATLDPITGRPYVPEFTIEDMNRLATLLDDTILPNYWIGELYDIVEGGLRRIEREGVQRRFADARTSYNVATPEQKHLIKLFVAWLFFYGIWMRFWKGPGNPWPQMGGEDDQTCAIGRRKEHIFIQNSVYTELSFRFDRDPVVRQWIAELPYIVGGYTAQLDQGLDHRGDLVPYLNNLILGEECMGYGGDRISGMGYFLATQILQVPNFNAFINEMLPELLQVESQVVNRQLGIIKQPVAANIRERYDTLVARQTALRGPVPRLPVFDVTRVITGKHTYED
jgi:hypothetical protein